MLRYFLLSSVMVMGVASAASAAPTGTDASTATMPPGEYNTIPTDRTTVNAEKNAKKEKDETAKSGTPTDPADAKTAPPPPDQTQPAPGQEPSPPPH